MTKIIQDNSVQEFLEKSSELLYKDEATNSLMLGLCEGMLVSPTKGSTLFVRMVEQDRTVSAAVQTPGMNLIVTYATTANLEVLA
ncbi:MAG TPA: hypothetical protein VN132_09930, partial [Bdellovibrio sp.]|nr:hypothetical protein [Bdellovibrio sp.]